MTAIDRILVVAIGDPASGIAHALDRLGPHRASLDLIVLSPERRLLTSLAISTGHTTTDLEDAALREAEQQARSTLTHLPHYLGIRFAVLGLRDRHRQETFLADRLYDLVIAPSPGASRGRRLLARSLKPRGAHHVFYSPAG